MFYLFGPSIPDDEFGAALKNGFHQLGDVRTLILIVAIRVDDDVRTRLEAIVHTRREGVTQAPIRGKTQHMIHSVLAGDVTRAVCTSIVDDQYFDFVDALDFSGNIAKCLGQRILFIEAWNLNDEFHSFPQMEQSYTSDHTASICAWIKSPGQPRFFSTDLPHARSGSRPRLES